MNRINRWWAQRRLRPVYAYCAIVACVVGLLVVWWFCHAHAGRPQQEGGASARLSAVAQWEKRSHTMRFDSVVAPIRVQQVAVPFDGMVQQVGVQYGEEVVRGQPLFVLYASDLNQTYRDKVTQYLESKNQYVMARSKFAGSEQLYHADVMDRESYVSEKNALQASLLHLMNQEEGLKRFLATLPKNAQFDYRTLSLQATDQVRHLLQHPIAGVSVSAPMTGVLMQLGGVSSGDQADVLVAGSYLKKDENPIAIGDLSGLSLRFNVPERAINRLKLGTAVVVSSDALPGVTLQGRIRHIGGQAMHAGSEAVFPVVAVVPTLPASVKHAIRVGMSAQVKIETAAKEAIYVPIQAVEVRHAQTGLWVATHAQPSPHWVRVVTGAVSGDAVSIERGVRPGDRVYWSSHQGS